MSFGWAVGDLAILSRLCLKIYLFWKNAEHDLQDVLQRFEYTGQQLKSLEQLLNETGWEPYAYAFKLKQDLESHYRFFSGLPALSGLSDPHADGLHSKSKDKAKLGFTMDDLDRIKANIEDHRLRLSEFKQDVVLRIVLQKSRHQISASVQSTDALPSSQGDANSNYSDPVSVFSKAQVSLEFAASITAENVKSHYEISAHSLHATPESLIDARSDVRNYIDEVVDAAESEKLYADNVSLSNHLDQLVKIGNAFDRVRRKLLRRSITLPPIPTSPQTLEDSIRNVLPNRLRHLLELPTPPPSVEPIVIPRTRLRENRATPNNRPSVPRSPSLNGPSRRDDFDPADTTQSLSLGPAGAASSAEDDTTNESRWETKHHSSRPSADSDEDGQSRTALRLLGKAYIGGHRLLGSSISEARLIFSVSEASACIQAYPVSPPMTASDLIFNQSCIFPRASAPIRIFRHAFEPGLEAYPRIHHPATGKAPDHDAAPFTINFLWPQIANAEGDLQPAQPVTALQYLFQRREDRDYVRGIIFGKTHLASAGVEEVSHNKRRICDMESITLWQRNNSSADADADADEAGPEASPTITITVPVYPKNGRDPERIAEYTVLSGSTLRQNIREARRARKYLTLDIQPIPLSPTSSPSGQTDPGSPLSSNASRAESFVSQSSTFSRLRRRSSTPKDVLYITFSEYDDDTVRDKMSFLDRLENTLLAGDEA